MHIYKGISDKGINEKKKGYPVITNFKHLNKKCFGVILMPLADGEKWTIASTECGDEEIHVWLQFTVYLNKQ